MTTHDQRLLSAAAAMLLAGLLGLPACSDSSGDGTIGEGSIDNDQPQAAVAVGTIAPGATIRIAGQISAFGADQFDSFRVAADVDTAVTVTLTPSDPQADVDFFVADGGGSVGQIVSTGETEETGSFQIAAGETAIVAVFGFRDTAYRLSLTGVSP